MRTIEPNSKVYHERYGIGTVRSIDDKYITVIFSVGEKKFAYPSSLNKYLFPVYKSDFLIKDNTLVEYVGKRKDVSVPDEVTIIGENAFRGSNIETVSFEGRVKKVNDGAFSDCTRLKSVSNTDKLESIGKGAFKNCRNQLAEDTD